VNRSTSIPPRLVTGLATVLLCSAATAAEWTLTGTHVGGEEEDGATYSSETITLRFAAGNRVRVRAYLPFVRLDGPDAVAWTVAGPTPIPPDRRRGSGSPGDPTGNGSGDPSGDPGGGEGSGNGTAPAVRGALTDPDASVSGLGDARLGLTARLLGQASDLHRLLAELDVKAPTADEDEGLGTGEWDARVGLGAERRGWHGTLYGGVGWTSFGDPDWIELRDGADAHLGFETEPAAGNLAWTGWIEAAEPAIEGRSTATIVGVGLRREMRRPWQLSAWAGLDGDSPDFGFSLTWSSGKTSWRAGRWGDRR